MPSTGLEEKTKEEIKEEIPKKDSGSIDKIKEPFFALSGLAEINENSPLVNIEISFRKCKRSGVFTD